MRESVHARSSGLCVLQRFNCLTVQSYRSCFPVVDAYDVGLSPAGAPRSKPKTPMQKEVLEASFLGKPGSELNMVFQPTGQCAVHCAVNPSPDELCRKELGLRIELTEQQVQVGAWHWYVVAQAAFRLRLTYGRCTCGSGMVHQPEAERQEANGPASSCGSGHHSASLSPGSWWRSSTVCCISRGCLCGPRCSAAEEDSCQEKIRPSRRSRRRPCSPSSWLLWRSSRSSRSLQHARPC